MGGGIDRKNGALGKANTAGANTSGAAPVCKASGIGFNTFRGSCEDFPPAGVGGRNDLITASILFLFSFVAAILITSHNQLLTSGFFERISKEGKNENLQKIAAAPDLDETINPLKVVKGKIGAQGYRGIKVGEKLYGRSTALSTTFCALMHKTIFERLLRGMMKSQKAASPWFL